MGKLRPVFNRVLEIAADLKGRGLATHAASCAFYAFLSLFPLTTLAASLVPCVGVTKEALLNLVDDIAPQSVAALIRVILANIYERVFPALPLSLLALLWSSAKAFSELLKGMTAMVDPNRMTGSLSRRFRGVLLTLALLTGLLLSLGSLIFGGRLVLLLGFLYPQLAGFLSHILWLRYLVMVLLLWLLFIFLYRSIPGLGLSFREVRAGAALSAAVWIVFSVLFSLCADRLFDVSLYGSMATMVLTMLWLFYCQYIMLIGAHICTRKQEKTGKGI